MMDLSKLYFNNYYYGGNFEYVPNYSFASLPNPFTNFNTEYFSNLPVFPNFMFFNTNFNFIKPIKPIFYNSYNQSDDNNNIFSYKLETPLDKMQKKNYIKPAQSKVTYTNNNKTDKSYMYLSKKEAEQKAKNDPNLELLEGGDGWSVADTFFTDIPYAKKGTGKILEKVAKMTGKEIVVTSALGTGEPGNLHQKKGTVSHHFDKNPKLDIRIQGNAKDYAEELKATGYFSHILIEKDHLDVQIDISKYRDFEAIA